MGFAGVPHKEMPWMKVNLKEQRGWLILHLEPVVSAEAAGVSRGRQPARVAQISFAHLLC